MKVEVKKILFGKMKYVEYLNNIALKPYIKYFITFKI